MAKKATTAQGKSPAGEARGVEVLRIQKKLMEITIIGTSPLIVHRFSHKAKGEMLAKQIGVKWPKEAKDPEMQYDLATYWIDEDGNELPSTANLDMLVDKKVSEFLGCCSEDVKALRKIKKPRFGFPAVGLKASAIRGAKSLGLVMTDMRSAFHIPVEFVEIHGLRRRRCDMVRIAKGTSDIRFRPEWPSWWMRFEVEFNETAVSPDIIANMVHCGGFSCGIGEGRPERGLRYGTFEVASDEKAAKLVDEVT